MQVMTLEELKEYEDPCDEIPTLFCGDRGSAQSVMRVYQAQDKKAQVVETRYVFVFLPSPCAGRIDAILEMGKDDLLNGWLNVEFECLFEADPHFMELYSASEEF